MADAKTSEPHRRPGRSRDSPPSRFKRAGGRILLWRKIGAICVVGRNVPIPDDLSGLDDHALAAELAARAGELLLGLRAGGGDPKTLRDAGDRQSHEFLMAELAKARPGDAVLSEEGLDDKARLTAERVWIVDPLDGTREFGEPGRSDWAVHVALWARAAEAPVGELVAGAVALPAQNRVLATRPAPQTTGEPCWSGDSGRGEGETGARRPGSSENSGGPSAGTIPGPGGRRPIRLVVSRSRASALVKDVAARLDAELVPCGSAGAKVATVVLGENDVYLHSGGFYEWDTAAPVAVARANGLHVSRIDGSDVRYNQENPLLPDILVCRFAIADRLLDAIREATYAI
jgi:3'(2'), 5'-bisphosphate nucleotidase